MFVLFIAYWYFNLLKLLKILGWLTTIGKKICEKKLTNIINTAKI